MVVQKKLETLNELATLRDSGFGKPLPRHGLQLLYWFANECISFDDNNEIYSECEPAEGDFGFHFFENRYDVYGEKLLPDINFPYYVVGNLNKPGANELPSYVTTYAHHGDGNTDRIIVSLDEEIFDKVYVTEHMNKSDYDPDATFRISKGLLLIIRNMNLEQFLQKTGYYPQIQQQGHFQDVFPIPTNLRLPTTASVTKTTSTVARVTPESHSLPPQDVQQDVRVDMEPRPTSQTSDTTIQIEPVDNKPKQRKTNYVPKQKGFWDMCTIL